MFDQGDIRKLMEEIDRYLAAVELFRSHGCEPTWRPEVAARFRTHPRTPGCTGARTTLLRSWRRCFG
jgi:hypothetical protein